MVIIGAATLSTAGWASMSSEKSGHRAEPFETVINREVPTVLAANVSQTVQVAKLQPELEDEFERYRKIPHAFGFKAFAIDPANGNWGQGIKGGFVKTAVTNAMNECRERGGQECKIYAIGNIIVDGLDSRNADIAKMLYQVKQTATNSDLDNLSSNDVGNDSVGLRLSVFFEAAEWGSLNTLETILDQGVDVDVRSSIGSTALMYAASRGQYETTKALLARGADVNVRNNVGKTAFSLVKFARSFAQQRNYRLGEYDAVIKLLEDAGADE